MHHAHSIGAYILCWLEQKQWVTDKHVVFRSYEQEMTAAEFIYIKLNHLHTVHKFAEIDNSQIIPRNICWKEWS